MEAGAVAFEAYLCAAVCVGEGVIELVDIVAGGDAMAMYMGMWW